jgi:hypothetical protein
MTRGRVVVLHCAYGLLVTLIAACTDQNASLAPGHGAGLEQFVTGAAANALNATGQFTMPPAASEELPVISQAQAESFALGLIKRSVADGGLAGAETERGMSIAWSDLSVCRRTLYAKSSWLPLDASVAASPYGPALQRGYGPYYLVSLCDQGRAPALLIAVSAYSTDLSLEDGMIVYPRVGGAWFQWRGIPPDQEAELAVGPEQAVRYAAQFTGRKVTAVPDLILPDRKDGGAADARWRVELDSPVTLRTKHSGQSVAVGSVYVRWPKRTPSAVIDVQVPSSNPDEPFEYRTALPKGPFETTPPAGHGVARRGPDFPAQYATVAAGDDLAH